MKNLIPLAYLNEACNVSINLEEKAFQVHLKFAQGNLRDILGSEFYDQIETQYSPIASSDTLSTDNAALYEGYIKDFLAWDTYYDSLGFSQSKDTPTGRRKFKDDNSELLNDLEMFSVEKNVLSKVNYYKQRMINYIKLAQANTSTKFPLYKEYCNNSYSFAISSISGNVQNNEMISVSKAVRANE